MKKLLFTAAVLAFGFGVSAQTIVSKEVQKRNVVFEEFTGINCGYCPVGHEITSTYAKQNEGRVCVVNIHQGGYAAKYTTKWGDALADQAKISGYPAFTMNRNQKGCSLINYYSNTYNYATDGAKILNEDSPVNVAAIAEIDSINRIMHVHVEVYYTKEIEQNFNMLNVYLLQDSIEGPQQNYNNANAESILPSGKYRHMHMFRDMITGNQWGDAIAFSPNGKIAVGTFVEKDYVYAIPMSISNEEVVLNHLNLVAFVSNGSDADCADLHSPKIWTGVKVIPIFKKDMSLVGNEISITDITAENVYGCTEMAKNITVSIKNNSEPITSMTLKYYTTQDMTGKTYDWTGNLAKNASTKIQLPDQLNVGSSSSELKVEVTAINGTALTKAISNTSVFIKPDIIESQGPLKLILKTDKKASQISWKVTNSEGVVVNQSKAYSNGSIVRDTVLLDGIDKEGCYVFELKDAGNDGASGGKYRLIAPDGNAIVTTNGADWGSGETKDLQIKGIVGLNEANENIFQSIVYPNPANNTITLSVSVVNSDDAIINVVDLTGRVVIDLGVKKLNSGENQININTENLANGFYSVKVITNNGITANKLSIIR